MYIGSEFVVIRMGNNSILSQYCNNVLASYPGLLTPVLVTSSANVGEGLVKLSHMQWLTWTCGGMAHSQKKHKEASALPITNTDRRTTKHSTSGSLGDISWVQKATLQLYRRNVPLLHTPRYVAARDSVLPGLPQH